MNLSPTTSILLVDDQQSSIAITQSILNRLGYKKVETVNSASEAFELIRTRHFDIVFSDWHMQPMNGDELLRQVKRTAGHKCPKFYFLTGDSGFGCIVTARELGADGLLVKPQRTFDLMNKIAATMKLQ